MYAEALCIDSQPMYFDQIERNTMAEEALSLCARCPVKTECLMIVQPRTSYFDGVCGGFIFKNGNPVGQRKTTIVKPDIVDEIAIERLIRGDIDWRQVGIKDRRHAAVKMRQRGIGMSTIMKTTHISGSKLKELFIKRGV